jgi:hypothetical protein
MPATKASPAPVVSTAETFIPGTLPLNSCSRHTIKLNLTMDNDNKEKRLSWPTYKHLMDNDKYTIPLSVFHSFNKQITSISFLICKIKTTRKKSNTASFEINREGLKSGRTFFSL